MKTPTAVVKVKPKTLPTKVNTVAVQNLLYLLSSVTRELSHLGQVNQDISLAPVSICILGLFTFNSSS